MTTVWATSPVPVSVPTRRAPRHRLRVVPVVDRHEASEVYARLSRPVYGYLRGQHVDDPDNLLGEVFLQVTASLPTFEGSDDDLRRWVFTIARNRVIDERRRQARRPKIVDGEVPEQPVEADGLVDDELVAALLNLTPEQREVIALRFIADLSLEAVAEMTGRTVGAVKAMQHRALTQLNRALRADDEDGDQGGTRG